MIIIIIWCITDPGNEIIFMYFENGLLKQITFPSCLAYKIMCPLCLYPLPFFMKPYSKLVYLMD